MEGDPSMSPFENLSMTENLTLREPQDDRELRAFKNYLVKF
jgi:hypothetical protein